MAESNLKYHFHDAADKLVKARCRLMTAAPFYAAMAIQMEWIKSERLETMGVRILSNGRVECLWNEKFVEEEDFFAVYAAIQHEIEHIIRLHCVRVDTRINELWNVAADFTINGTKKNPRIGTNESGQSSRPILPFEGNTALQARHQAAHPGAKPIEACFIPEKWDEKASAEEYYDKLLQEAKVKKLAAPGSTPGNCPGGAGEEEDPNGQGQGNSPGSGSKKEGYQVTFTDYGSMIGDHSIWDDSDVTPDEARVIVREMVKEAISQCAGKVPGHLQEAINKLQKPIVRWRQLLRNYIGQHIGNQRTTYSRQNRRRPAFGNPGISHHAAAHITCIIDTSGSVSSDMLEKYFTEIEAMSTRAKISVLQWDHDFQGYEARYRRGGWKKFKVNGRGGTDMVAPYAWLTKNNLAGDVVILLTDGYTAWPEKPNYPCIFCITTDVEGPTWGLNLKIK